MHPDLTTELRFLIGFGRQQFPHLQRLPLSPSPAFGNPHVHTFLLELQKELAKAPEAVRLSVSSVDVKSIVATSAGADTFSNLALSHEAARSVSVPAQSSSGLEPLSVADILNDPDRMPSLPLNDGSLMQYVHHCRPNVARAWLLKQDGAPRYLQEVFHAAFPSLSRAQVDLTLKSFTVEGQFAFTDLFLLALHSRFHFDLLRQSFTFHVSGRRYYTDLLSDANEKTDLMISKMGSVIIPKMQALLPAASTTRLETLYLKLSRAHKSASSDSMQAMMEFLLVRPEVQAAIALGNDQNTLCYNTLDNILCVHDKALRDKVGYDISPLMYFMGLDVAGAFGTPGKAIGYDHVVGPLTLLLLAHTGTGKTTAILMMLREFRASMKLGEAIVIFVATNAEKASLSPLLEQAGFTVFLYEDNKHMWDASRSRLDNILSHMGQVCAAIFSTVHSAAKLIMSEKQMEKVVKEHAERGAGTAFQCNYLNLPSLRPEIRACWCSELGAQWKAFHGSLITEGWLHTAAIQNVCSSCRFTIADGEPTQESVLYAANLSSNMRVHVLVRPTVPQQVSVFQDAATFIDQRLVPVLQSKSSYMVMSDSASLVPYFVAACSADPSNVPVFGLTADRHDLSVPEINERLAGACGVVASPFLSVCADITAFVSAVLIIVTGRSCDAATLLQMAGRARCNPPISLLFLNLHMQIRMTPASMSTKDYLLTEVLNIAASPNNVGGFFDTIASAIPEDLEQTLRQNCASAIVKDFDAYFANQLRLFYLAGMGCTVPANPDEETVLWATMGVTAGMNPSLVAYCECKVTPVDATFDSNQCPDCGIFPIVLAGGTVINPWCPPVLTGKALKALKGFQCGQFWMPYDLEPQVPVVVKPTMPAYLAIADRLRNGDQPDTRRLLQLLSMFLARGANVVHVSASATSLPPSMQTLVDALRNGAEADPTGDALRALMNQPDLITTEYRQLVSQMLSSTSDDQRTYKSVMLAQRLFWALGLPIANKTLDGIGVEMAGMSWFDRFPGANMKRKVPWPKQLVNLAGYPDHLAKYVTAVFFMVTGLPAPVYGAGPMDLLLQNLFTVQFARLLVIVCHIAGSDQTADPFIISVDGVSFENVDVQAPLLTLVAPDDRANARSVLEAVAGSASAFGVLVELDSLQTLTLMDAIKLLKRIGNLAWRMAVKFDKKSRRMRWNRAFICTRLSILYLLLRRDPPRCSPEGHAFLLGKVESQLRSLTLCEVPLLYIAGVQKPSVSMPRTATVSSLGSTLPYREDGEDETLTQEQKSKLLAYMQGIIGRSQALQHFGSWSHCEELWGRLSSDDRALVLGQAGTARAHVALKLTLGKLAMEILESQTNPTSVLSQTIRKMKELQRQDTLDSLADSLGSVDPGFRAGDAVHESDLSPEEEDDEEEEEEEPPSKKCRFLDDEAGEDDRVSSSVETETYD